MIIRLFNILALAALGFVVPALAQPTERQLFAEKAARRFPQPVRVGDLFDRHVLQPTEKQQVIGRLVALTKSDDGGVDVLIRQGGWFGYGGRYVAVPIESLALLGEHVVAMEITPAQMESRSASVRKPENELPPDTILRMAITRPFH